MQGEAGYGRQEDHGEQPRVKRTSPGDDNRAGILADGEAQDEAAGGADGGDRD